MGGSSGGGGGLGGALGGGILGGGAGAVGGYLGGPLGNIISPGSSYFGGLGQKLGGMVGLPGMQTKNPYQVDPGPRPDLAGFQSINDVGIKLYGDLGNQSAFNALTQRATQQGPSPWLSMQMQNLGRQTMNQQDAAARGAMGSLAQSRAQLASRGGLSGGAAERLARSGASDLAAQRQNIANQAALQGGNFAIQDEATKMGLLRDATSANLAQQQFLTDAQKFNVQNQINDVNARNQYNMGKYQEQMKGYGAAQSANAIGSAGK